MRKMNGNMKAGVDYTAVAVAFFCNDDKGNFILQKRSENCRDERGCWDGGGGQLEFGEELGEAALRELKEEYGISGEIQEQLPSYAIAREQDGKTHWIAVPFFIKADIEKARIMEPKKVTEIGIFRLDNLPRPLHSCLQKELKDYKEYFDRYGHKG